VAHGLGIQGWLLNKARHELGSGASTRALGGIALAALGVVYGDIGTSPLYAIKECFSGPHSIGMSPANILGVLSLIFWSLTIVVTFKYVFFIMRADNKGEGGIFALLELLPKTLTDSPRLYQSIVFLGLFGAALLYGDGIITPAISVLSAVEGLETATSAAKPLVVPITCVVLFCLFMVQRRGTTGIGRVFGPVMLVWFATIGSLGLREILINPTVLSAINPLHGVDFFVRNHLHGMVVLGSVVLCITGGEALYADMGHFGIKPIRLSWLTLVMPCLLLNYFGQGALLLIEPEIADHPFYGLVPGPLLYPMVGLATMATVIASQAMISGVFSMTRQAVQLGFFPRMRIVHTSSDMEGQIYVPGINWALMLACLSLVLVFRESSGLAGAYGIAVTATMGCTTILYFFVTTRTWGWPLWKAGLLAGVFLFFDLTYFSANLLKVFDGGWLTLTIAAFIVLAMMTWKRGRSILAQTLGNQIIPLHVFHKDLVAVGTQRVEGAAVFMSVSPKGAPITLSQFFIHTGVLFEKVVVLSIAVTGTPLALEDERIEIINLGDNFYRIIARFGFMETPNVPGVIEAASQRGLDIDPMEVTYFLGRESLLLTGPSTMSSWRKMLFSFMSRNAPPATTYFGLPPDRVVELGMQVAL
jgi:KUP system potassium uptake protein